MQGHGKYQYSYQTRGKRANKLKMCFSLSFFNTAETSVITRKQESDQNHTSDPSGSEQCRGNNNTLTAFNPNEDFSTKTVFVEAAVLCWSQCKEEGVRGVRGVRGWKLEHFSELYECLSASHTKHNLPQTISSINLLKWFDFCSRTADYCRIPPKTRSPMRYLGLML